MAVSALTRRFWHGSHMSKRCLRSPSMERVFMRWSSKNAKDNSRTSSVNPDLDQSKKVSPLHGIRVLDLTRVLAGPYCTMILGDLGADVIKVEKPGVGDDTRTWGPPFCGTESAYFLSINRNKKSVTVNMQHPEGADIIRRLACESDILVENYVPGKLGEMGLGYSDLAQVAPHLVYCSITGYGQTGPYQKRGGYDVVAAAMTGLLHITGPQDGEPCRVGVAMTDLSTGLYAYGAIMAALLQRYKTGRGQHIDCNLLSTQVATMTHIASNYLNAGIEAKRYGTGHGSIVPYQAFKTKDDRYLIVGAGNNGHFRSLCQIMKLDDLAEDPRYAENSKRVQNRVALIDTISKRFLEKDLADWLEVFEGCKLPYGPLNNMQQVFDDPQVQHLGLIQEMTHPISGHIKLPGPAVRYSESELQLRCVPPLLGEHTDKVLASVLGETPDSLSKLRRKGAIA